MNATTPARWQPFFWASAIFTAVGLLSGLFYREFTKHYEFEGRTQLAVAHTHLLLLGTVMGLLFLIVEHHFRLSRSHLFWAFVSTWLAGTTITSTMLVIKGSLQVSGSTAAQSKALAGVAGLGHMTLTAAFVLFFLTLLGRLGATNGSPSAAAPATSE